MTSIYTDRFNNQELNIDLGSPDDYEDGRELIFATMYDWEEVRIVLSDAQLKELGELLLLEGYVELPVDIKD